MKVRILPKAEADVQKMRAYISGRSPEGALVWLTALEKACEQLAENARSCAVADENDDLEFEVRQSLFRTRRGSVYRLVFTIFNDEVQILRVRGPGQAPVGADDL